jgi:hypothetical protein
MGGVLAAEEFWPVDERRLKACDMILIFLTVVCIASLIAVLVIFLFIIGGLLNRIAENLDDCSGNVKTITRQAEVLIPAVEHINRTGGELSSALPLLYGNAERITAKLTPPVVSPVSGRTNMPASGRRRARR